MQDKPTTGYLELTTPWEHRCDDGLVLRGRRAQGAGPTLHFLSGNGFCGGVYWPFLRQFVPDYGLFIHDIEGHGRSGAPAKFSGVDTTVQRIRAVAEAQGLGQAPLVGMGHSFGAALTLRLAAGNPGLFRGLVLLDPIMFPAPMWLGVRLLSAFGRHPFARGARNRRSAWPTREAALAHLRNRGIYAGWTEEAIECFADHAMEPRAGQHVLSCPPALEAEIFDRPLYVWRDLARVDCPVLFLRGAQSYPFFAAAERAARRVNPRVQTRSLPGGHCFMQQDPPAAQAAVREFLERL